MYLNNMSACQNYAAEQENNMSAFEETGAAFTAALSYDTEALKNAPEHQHVLVYCRQWLTWKNTVGTTHLHTRSNILYAIQHSEECAAKHWENESQL